MIGWHGLFRIILEATESVIQTLMKDLNEVDDQPCVGTLAITGKFT